MALTVEDGTGLAAADSFVALADADAYHTARGNSTWTGEDAAKEQALRRASHHLTYSYRWKGYPVRQRSQALAWPRTYVEDEHGYEVPSDEVPNEIKVATYELALRELVEPGALDPDYTPADRVKSEQVGPLAVTYDLSNLSARSTAPVVNIVQDIIGPLLAVRGSIVAGETYRA